MTYCVAIRIDAGLCLVSDSRTNAGVDNISTYSKMFTFSTEGERQVTVLSSGNLATTQGVIGQIIEGWEIQKIEPNQVVLRQSGKTRILKLVDKPNIKLQRRRDQKPSRRRKTSPLAPPRQPTFNRRATPEPRTR